ncbi:unnamed protein product [Lactuca saligna]|uniref:Sister chromatid cohesion 1 protein 2 n=1 Tax=Lactuca saligna TaxID=75948 RepID=A0AA35Z0G9_LACSI|nr:unnamed protein product [Lactuca saligna]
MGTIYKHMLMGNKKVDLGHVWMAAHFPHRIRKEFVQQTNISSSVDKILVDQVSVVTYRILGFLLLGVTRLYSKKVEYLLIDCNHSLYEMKVYLEGRKKVNININVGGMCLPEASGQRSKTNMDAPESSSRKRSNTLVDAMRADFFSITLPENFELDAFDLQVVEDESSSEHHVKSNLEIVLPDTDSWENDETGHHSEASPENIRTRFSLEDRLAPMELDEPDEEVTLPKIPFLEHDPEWRNTNSCDNYMTFEDRNDKHQDEEECTTGEKEEKSVLETTFTLVDDDDNITFKPSPQKLSVAVNVTPQSKRPSVSGKHKSDSMAVRTPAVQERVSVRASTSNSRKRKCVYDDVTVIRNVVYKDWVTNASDLVGKRTKVPTTRSRTRSCDYIFIQPIIPLNAGFPSDLRSAISRIEVEQLQLQVADDGVGVGIGSCAAAAASVMLKSVEENEAEIIAPLTPTTQSASKANQEGPTSSCEDVFPINDQEFDNLQSVSRQGPSSSHLQNQGHENWSALTKNVGGYLHTNFTHKKDEVVKLGHILKEKTKRECAMFFSEILLLKTGGYIDVKQKKAYDEIFVMQTLKLKEVFGADSSNP